MNDLLHRMPNLKRLVTYSDDPEADLKIIRDQQKRCDLRQLEILFGGFSEPVKIELEAQMLGLELIEN